MNALIRFLLLLIVVLGLAFLVQQFRKQPAFTSTPAKTFDLGKTKTEEHWSESDLNIRRQLATQAQVSEKLITLNDVKFKNDFTDFLFIKTPSYSILTENKSFAFQNAFQTLTTFEKQFRQFFSPLIRIPKQKTMEVVFFDSQKTFDRFRSSIGVPAWVAGFYNPHQHRLFLFNAMDISKTVPFASHVKIPFRYQEILLPTLTGQMDQVISIMRHEASHQLCAHYNILPPEAASWLHEGLAVYCEKTQIGLPHRQYMTLLPYVPKVSISELMGAPHFSGMDEKQVFVAYIMSWSLVYYLMQNQRQAGFYQFIREMNKNPSASTNIQTLAKKLNTSSGQLEKDFELFMKQFSGSKYSK